MRHALGAAVARTLRSSNPFDALTSDHARKLAHALSRPRARDRRWPRDYRQRDREPRRSPPREHRREIDRQPARPATAPGLVQQCAVPPPWQGGALCPGWQAALSPLP
jgi:hypothetical protein